MWKGDLSEPVSMCVRKHPWGLEAKPLLNTADTWGRLPQLPHLANTEE